MNRIVPWRRNIFGKSIIPFPQIVPPRLDGECRVQQDLLHHSLHLANGTPEPSPDGPARRAYVKVVRLKLSTNIDRKNLRPRSAPSLLCKRIVVRSPFCFDVPSQCGRQSTVPAIRQAFFVEIRSKFQSASRNLQPCEFSAFATKRAQYIASNANSKWPYSSVAPNIHIMEMRWIDVDGSKELGYHTASNRLFRKRLSN